MLRHESDDDLWHYNCLDCVRTREVGETLDRVARDLEKTWPELPKVRAFQQRMFWPVLQAMQRGVRIDPLLRKEFDGLLVAEIAEREAAFKAILGHPLNPRSSPQMKALFYEDLQCKPNYKRGGGGPAPITLDDQALEKILNERPILAPLIYAIQEPRSLNVFLSTFTRAALDVDGRMRTSYSVGGAESYRLKSKKNAFGSGTNLQNIPKGGEDAGGLRLPNIRRLFIPDHGYTIFDTDLSKADLRIVVWESDEREMKAMLREGRDPYVETAREFYHDPTIRKTLDDGSEHPKYRIFKSFCHGTHYLGTPTGLSQRLGLTVHEAERTQRWYFAKYPSIKLWQNEFKHRVSSRRFVQNIFGYRRYYFGRADDAMLREAIAWLPQSTVALYINHIWLRIFERHPSIQILMQVHDSLVGQFPTHQRDAALAAIAECGQVVLPYEDPLIIPLGVKTSESSWGDCK